jgi:Cof subfamily protein (haloacid dehalogenase superfamily)
LQYTLVASDMDGTLLRHDKSISERNVQAIRRFEAAGGRFTIATGRGVGATARYMAQLQNRTPLLLCNGCLGYDPITGEDVFRYEIPRPVLKAVWPILLDHALELVLHSNREATIFGMNEIIAEHLRLDGITATVRPDLNPENAGPVVKVLTIGDPPVLDAAEAAILAAGLPVKLVRSYETYLEVLPEQGGKGAGLTALMHHLGVDREQTLAVGDFLNDLDMLQTAGLGVAMANAHPGLKAVAARQTLSNEEDGVAAVLEALVEGRPVGMPIE